MCDNYFFLHWIKGFAKSSSLISSSLNKTDADQWEFLLKRIEEHFEGQKIKEKEERNE